jgi:hypothetical protein
MTVPKEKHYEVLVAGASYATGQVALKREVITLDDKDVARLEGCGAVAETDRELTGVREEAVPVEHAQPQESQEEHAAKVTAKGK